MITTTGDSGSSAFIGALPLGEDLAAAVEDVLLRFSVAEMAFTAVPLSAAAISLALSAGCLAFAGDWLITATLDHIKCVLLDLGLSLNDRPHERVDKDISADNDAGIDMDTSMDTDEWVPDGGLNTISGDGGDMGGREGHHCDVPALNGILEAAVRRWGRVLSIDGSTGKLQEGDSDGTISRLSSVLLLAPDDFLLLAFDSAGYSQGENSVDSSGDDERRTATTVVNILEAVITSTLTKLSTSIGHYAVLRAGSETGGTGQEAMLLACTSRVLRLASAFLHARCAHAFHCAPSASMDTTFQPASWTSDPRQPSTGETLVRACAGLLQGMFDSRRRGLVGGAEQDDLMINRAAVDALNLLNALLVLLAADATHLPAAFHAESLENALGEARAALVEEGMFSMTERGCNFLDRGPNALAAYLQFCLLWNLLCSQANLTPHRSWGGCGSVEVPFDVLDRIMTMRIVNSDGGCRATWGWSMSLMQAKARWTVLHILAARCIECAAPRRPFSRKQVLSLQLALQGIACEGDARSASAALAAMGALWERYTGVLSPIDLFQQPWNEFTLECCFENARWLLVNGGNGDSTMRSDIGGVGDSVCRGGGKYGVVTARYSMHDTTYRREVPNGVEVEPCILISHAAELAGHRYRLRQTTSCSQPRLRSSLAWSSGYSGGGVAGLLSATSTACVYECLALLAEDACSVVVHTNEDSVDQRKRADGAPVGVSRAGSDDLSEHGHMAAGTAGVHLWNAIGQLIRMLLLSRPTEQKQQASPSVVGNDTRGEGYGDGHVMVARHAAAKALLALHDQMSELYPVEPWKSDKSVGVTGTSATLSTGTYFDNCANDAVVGCITSYGGVLVVQHELWQTMSRSCLVSRCSATSRGDSRLASVSGISRSDVKTLIERLSP